MLSFFVRWMGMLTYVDGLYSAWQMYWAVRFIESLWFGLYIVPWSIYSTMVYI